MPGCLVSDGYGARGHLSFEPLEERHALELYEPFLAEQIYRFIPERAPKSMESATRQFHALSAGSPLDSNEVWHNWAIRDSGSASYVGTLQATIFTDGSLWIGYKMAPAYWNNGFATMSVKWLVAELAGRYPGLPVHASVDTRNRASIRVLEKAGFGFIRREPAEIHGMASEDCIYQISGPPEAV